MAHVSSFESAQSTLEGNPLAPAARPSGETAPAEDRILRVWTPMLLRMIPGASVALLRRWIDHVGSVVRALFHSFGDDSPRFIGRLCYDAFAHRGGCGWRRCCDCDDWAFPIDLVPLARLAFCFILFLKQEYGLCRVRSLCAGRIGSRHSSRQNRLSDRACATVFSITSGSEGLHVRAAVRIVPQFAGGSLTSLPDQVRQVGVA